MLAFRLLSTKKVVVAVVVVVVVAFAVAAFAPRVCRFLGRSLRLCHCTNENAIRGYFVGLRPNKNNHGGFSLAFAETP